MPDYWSLWFNIRHLWERIFSN